MKLKFHCRGDALVPDLAAQEASVKRFIGRQFRQHENGAWGWFPCEQPQDVESRPEYVTAAKDGCLWPADEATAKACGVAYDPAFGEGNKPVLKKDKQ